MLRYCPTMTTHKIYSLFGIIFAFFQLCNSTGFFRSNYQKRYGKTIHQVVAKCGAPISVGDNERVIFTPDSSFKASDIHFIDAHNSLTTEAPTTALPTHPLDISFPNPVGNLEDETTSDKIVEMKDVYLNKGEVAPGPFGNHIGKQNTIPHPLTVEKTKYVYPKPQNQILPPTVNNNGHGNENNHNMEKYAVKSPHKPKPGDKHVERPSPRLNKGWQSPKNPRYSSDASYGTRLNETRIKRQNLINTLRRNPRSIYSKRRTAKNRMDRTRTEGFSGRPICTWTFTMKRNCNRLVAHITKLKTGEMNCNEQYLHFKGADNERM